MRESMSPTSPTIAFSASCYENVNIVATAAKPLISALSAQLRAAFAIV